MNESFDIKRFYALLNPYFLKRRIIGEVLLTFLMTIIFLLQKSNSLFFILSIIIFGSAHRMHLDFISSQSGLSRFLLLPATYFEKFLALLINTILWPTIQILIIYKCVLFVSNNFSFFSNVQPINIDQLYLFNLLFVIMFFLRLLFRWDGLDKYLLFFIVVLITLVFGEMYFHSKFSSVLNYQAYHCMFYLSVSFSLVLIAYQKTKRIIISRLKSNN